MIRLLIVDDSSFMRSAIKNMLQDSSDIEIVAEAKNGLQGLELAEIHQPDIITLDIEMPVCNGLDMLEKLMQTNPTPVIMLSSLTTQDAEPTLKALELGALDFIPKYKEGSSSINDLKKELVEKIHIFSKRAAIMRMRKSALKHASTTSSTMQTAAKPSSIGSGHTAQTNGSNLANGTYSTLASRTESRLQSSSSTLGSAAKVTAHNTDKSLQERLNKYSNSGAGSVASASSSTSVGSGATLATNRSSSITNTTSAARTNGINGCNGTSGTNSTSGNSLHTTTSSASGKSELIQLPSGISKKNLVGIGVSTGGPPAIQKVLMSFPKEFPACILIAQHMPASFTNAFAARLNSLCEIEVMEAYTGAPLNKGTAYVCPGGKHIKIENRKNLPYMVVTEEPTDALYKPSANVLFESLADFSRHSLGVMMTGMGNDGLEGMKIYKQKNGKTIAQDEQSCVVYGMPKAVVDAGLIDEVVPLDKIAKKIVQALYE